MTETVSINIEVTEEQAEMLTWALWENYDESHGIGDGERAAEWKELYDIVSEAADE